MATVNQKKTTVRDMTEGSIVKQVILFALPLMLGNVFQMLYNTVDSIVVGNFVGTQALAAVGSTTMIVNMMVFFFNGFSAGAGVVIANYFGAKDMEKLHKSIETTMAATFLLSILFTIGGVAAVKPMLRFMATPEDVFGEATVYLQIYIGGISGLLIYNMGSGILRAVGDTMRPLYFLILTSVLNIILDLVFVLGLHRGIEGVAWATILSQFIPSDPFPGHLPPDLARPENRPGNSGQSFCGGPARRNPVHYHGLFQCVRPVLCQLLRFQLHGGLELLQ